MMDWYRAYHGTCTDPKWQLVSRKAKVPVGTVVAIWFMLLETASQASERGSVERFEPETIDVFYGYEDGTTQAVFDAMEERGLICNGRLCAWEKRQPKREREYDNSGERVRQYRERKRQENASVTPCNASVTPCNASVTPCNAQRRLEEKRLDYITSNTANAVSVDAGASTGGKEEQKTGQKKPAMQDDGECCWYKRDKIPCPYKKIVGLYHAALPALPSVATIPHQRKQNIHARWIQVGERLKELNREDSEAERLAYFQRLFDKASKSGFLTGRIPTSSGDSYVATFDKLMSPGGFLKLIEGRYDDSNFRR